MTVDKNTWLLISQILYQARFQNLNATRPFKDHPLATKFTLHVEDGMVRLRRGGDVRRYDPTTNQRNLITSAEFVESFAQPIFETFHDCPNLKTYVLCFDPCNQRRIEKMATKKKRDKQSSYGAITLDEFTLPPEASTYFIPDLPLPGELKSVFRNNQVKQDLYVFFTDYFRDSIFRDRLQEGQTFIFSGAAIYANEDTRSFCNMPPLVCTKSEWRFEPKWNFPSLSEGDLDVWRWARYVFPEEDAFVNSRDGDIFLIGLLQMREIIKATPDRKVYFGTVRQVGIQDVPIGKVKYYAKQEEKSMEIHKRVFEKTGDILAAYQASGVTSHSNSNPYKDCPKCHGPLTERPARIYTYIDCSKCGCIGSFKPLSSSSSSSSSSAPTKTETVFKLQCVDMVGVCLDIVNEVMNKEITIPSISHIHNPIEVWVLILVLSSTCDYVDSKRITSGCVAQTILDTYLHFTDLGDLIAVWSHPDKPFHYFSIDIASLQSFIDACYKRKVWNNLNLSKKNNTPEKLEVARQKSFETLKKKDSYPKLQDIQVVAAQCVWMFQYWTNGVNPAYEIVDGTITDEAGQSIYGFDDNGWTSFVSPVDKIFCPLPSSLYS